jgi:hypothetical protein
VLSGAGVQEGRARIFSGRTLTLSKEWALRTILNHQIADMRGLPFTLWSRRAVSQLILADIGTEVPIRTTGEHFTCLKEHKDDIEVFYLPANSPQANPDEYLNRDYKTQLRSAARNTSPDSL